jgi:hypothetical protein
MPRIATEDDDYIITESDPDDDFIVEDGSCVVDANSYVYLEYVLGYLRGERREQWEALTTEQQKELAITASLYIDRKFRWFGKRETAEQGLSWPRESAVFDGFPVYGVPVRVKQAVCEAIALLLADEELWTTEVTGQVQSEQVASLRTAYFENKREYITRFDALDCFLRGLYVSAEAGLTFARVART